jgi:hypothetical protein
MKILIATIDIPGYVPSMYGEWLKENTEHDITIISCPSKYQRQNREKFVPIASHFINTLDILRKAKGKFDIAIAPDPALVLGLWPHRLKGDIKKLIYWRLDYWPKKYSWPFDWTYHVSENNSLKMADEIWSIAPLDNTRVINSLNGNIKKTLHVPYLMHYIPQDLGELENPRSDQVIWIGTDRDESTKLALKAIELSGVDLVHADYSRDETRVTDQELRQILSTSKVGLVIYNPEPKSCKYYCDPGRLHHYLAYGLPVVMTRVAPIWRDIISSGAGIDVDYTPESISQGINYCIRNFDQMSQAALQLTREYTFWSDFNPIC